MSRPPAQPLHANLPVLENFDLTAVVDQDVHSEGVPHHVDQGLTAERTVVNPLF